MTKLNNRQIAARKRAQEMKLIDPMFYKRNGSKGGSVTGIAKGFGTMLPEQRKEYGKIGAKVRWGSENN